jgi:hypothetical protein
MLNPTTATLQKCVHTYTRIRTHTRICAHTHAHTRTHTHIRIHREAAATSSGAATADASALLGGEGAEEGVTAAAKAGGRKRSSRLNSMQQEGKAAGSKGEAAGGVALAAARPTRGRAGSAAAAAAAVAQPGTVKQSAVHAAGPPVTSRSTSSSATAGAKNAHTPLGSPTQGSASHTTGPVLLVLQHALHALPWEGMPALRASRAELYRTPGLAVAAASSACLRAVQRLQHSDCSPASSSSPVAAAAAAARGGQARSECTAQEAKVRKGVRGKGEADEGDSVSAVDDSAAGTAPGAGSSITPHDVSAEVDLRSTYFVLNPGGDLTDTQACFQDWFAGRLGWQVGAMK